MSVYRENFAADIIRIGDVVEFKSGSKPMTVSNLFSEATLAQCYWFTESRVEISVIPVIVLKLVT